MVGGRADQIRVEVMPERLAGYNLSLQQVAGTIQTANAESNVGAVEAGMVEHADDVPRYDAGTHRAQSRGMRRLLTASLLLALGGCAFLPRPLVAADIAEGRLFPVAQSPTPTRVAYLIGAAERRDTPMVDGMISAIHSCVTA